MLVGNVVLRKPFLYFHRVIYPSLIKSLFLFVLKSTSCVCISYDSLFTDFARSSGFSCFAFCFFLVSRPVCSRLVQVFMLSCFFFYCSFASLRFCLLLWFLMFWNLWPFWYWTCSDHWPVLVHWIMPAPLYLCLDWSLCIYNTTNTLFFVIEHWTLPGLPFLTL